MRLLSSLCAVLAGVTLAAQQPSQPAGQFRAGISLVTVDAYVSKDGVAVTDLRPDEIEVLEDGVAQKVENFRLVRGRQPLAAAAASSTLSVSRAEATDPDARVFVVFFDTWHISTNGSSAGAAPVSGLLHQVVGADDLVGWSTPDLPARSMPLTRRTAGIERILEQSKQWGERDRVNTDPREAEFMACYPDDPRRYPEFIGVAKELIERRRERKTLLALEEMVTHLGRLRDDRKFLLLLTEGWVQFRPNHRLSAERIRGSVPQQSPVRAGSDGRITTEPEPANASFNSCERERATLALLDHSRKLEDLAQRANRENVSFYIVDPRGATPFDDAIGVLRPATPPEDRVRLAGRQDGLRVLAEQTDGVALLNATYTREGTARMMADLGSYYLMTYNSTNARLDGRFRKITVRVKRSGVEVRARPGYRAFTEDEARAAAAPAVTGPSASVTRALEGMAQARGNLPVRIQAAGGRGLIRAVVELDAATVKQPEWAAGGSLRVSIEPARAGSAPAPAALQTVTIEVAAGQRSIPVGGLEAGLAAGRYTVRAELTPRSGREALNIATVAGVPGETAIAGPEALASRRGPSTGLAYVPTADQRFRRTERLRIEVPFVADGVIGTGRVLTREGQALPLVVTYSTAGQSGVADVTLAPLAAGEYVLELALARGGTTETVAYGFRIVP